MPEPPWANSPYVDSKYWDDPNPPKEAFKELPPCGKCSPITWSKKDTLDDIDESISTLRDLIDYPAEYTTEEKLNNLIYTVWDTLEYIQRLVEDRIK